MGHNIHFNERTGKHAFFSVKQPAWHNLGQVVADHPNSAEALRFAGLDYQVVKSPIFTKPEGLQVSDSGDLEPLGKIPVPSHFVTLRSDLNIPLGVVGKDYKIIQNTDAFAFFDAIVADGKGINYETAGALGNGERIFITAKLAEGITIGNDDHIDNYIFLSTSHDGTGSITAAFTPVRIVCQNTLNAAMGKLSNVVRIRHTSGAKERLKQAHQLMGIVSRSTEIAETTFNRWSKIRISDKEVKKLIELALAPNTETAQKVKLGAYDELSTNFKNQAEKAFSYAMMSDAQLLPTTEGTLFGAYNAVTGYFQNVRNYKTEEEKMKSILFGGTAQTKGQKAFNLCQTIASDGLEILGSN